MVTDITLNKVSSYTEPTTIKDLKKLNFFFGSNGSGKSTIAKFLDSINVETEDDQEFFGHCFQSGFDPESCMIDVFDEVFVKRNFLEKDHLPGIFSFDEENKEIERKIEKEQKKIRECQLYLENDLKNFKENLDLEIEQIFKGKKVGILDKCFQKRDIFNESMPLVKLKFSGNKNLHFKELIDIITKGIKKPSTFPQLIEDYEFLYEQNPEFIINYLSPRIYREIRRLEVKINIALEEIFTGNKEIDIAQMIQDLNLQKWVEEGIDVLEHSPENQKCPFCQKETIDQELIQKFQQYFDHKYKKKKQHIEELFGFYHEFSVQFIDQLVELKNEFKKNENLSDLVLELSSHFESQKKTVKEKLNKTNEIFKIESIYEFKNLFSSINKEVRVNNEIAESIEEKKSNLDLKFWNYMAFKSQEEIDLFYLNKEKLETRKAATIRLEKYLRSCTEKWRKEIQILRKGTINTSTAKDNINSILKGAGYGGFEIKELDKSSEEDVPKYYLKRNHSESENVFNSLSEGEKNFIAFLYFNEVCKGTLEKEQKERKKIIVIDDPVSSLDSQALFIVTTIIRELAKKKGRGKQKNQFFNPLIKQIFVFTHNLYFYKEVTFMNGSKLCSDMAFYQVGKSSNFTTVVPIASNSIDNDYNLLWRNLNNLKNTAELASNVVIANIMRRILQSYLNFTRKTTTEWSIIDELDQDDPKRILFGCLFSHINEDSHHCNPNEDFYYQRITNASNNDLFGVFELIFKEINGKDHFEAMMEYSSK